MDFNSPFTGSPLPAMGGSNSQTLLFETDDWDSQDLFSSKALPELNEEHPLLKTTSLGLFEPENLGAFHPSQVDWSQRDLEFFDSLGPDLSNGAESSKKREVGENDQSEAHDEAHAIIESEGESLRRSTMTIERESPLSPRQESSLKETVDRIDGLTHTILNPQIDRLRRSSRKRKIKSLD